MTPLGIGTRGSPLALWQARWVAERLQPLAAPRPVVLVEIETRGDQERDRPLAQIGGDGLFTKEIQRAVLDGRADVAVHSLKDLPTAGVSGLVLAAIPPRGTTGDAFLSRRHPSWDSLPIGAVVGTSSLRRRSQALHRRPDLRVIDLRGNVETRLRKLTEQDLDGIILAQAGLERLGLQEAITEILDPSWMLPAVGQGALGLECRDDDTQTLCLLRAIDDEPTQQAVLAERALLRCLGGGCLLPLGVRSRLQGPQLHLAAAVLSPDGTQRVAGEASGPAADPETLGRHLAELLLARGARQVLAAVRPQ
jgi:hydroxymethylbilane synthase